MQDTSNAARPAHNAAKMITVLMHEGFMGGGNGEGGDDVGTGSKEVEVCVGEG